MDKKLYAARNAEYVIGQDHRGEQSKQDRVFRCYKQCKQRMDKKHYFGCDIQTITRWIGYLEHVSADCLAEYQENVGKGGYTIFAKIVRERYGVDFQGIPWCVTFVFAVHPGNLGKPCTGVWTLARRMIRRGRWRRKTYQPRPGDLIFCRNNPQEVVGHVGIVERVYGEYVISIDGNTVDPTGHFDPHEGGAVERRVRHKSDWHIVGYAQIYKR